MYLCIGKNHGKISGTFCIFPNIFPFFLKMGELYKNFPKLSHDFPVERLFTAVILSLSQA